MIDLEIAQDRRVKALELRPKALAPVIDLVGRGPVGEVVIASPEQAHAGGILTHPVDADGGDCDPVCGVVPVIADEIEAHLALGDNGVSTGRDDVFRPYPVQTNPLDEMARKGVEFAHQGREETQRRLQPEFDRAGIERRHAQPIRRQLASVDSTGICHRIEITQHGKALRRINDPPGRPGNVLGRQRVTIRPDQALAQAEGPDQAAFVDRPVFRQPGTDRAVRRVFGEAGMDLLVDQRRGGKLATSGIETVRQAGRGDPHETGRRAGAGAGGETGCGRGGDEGAAVEHLAMMARFVARFTCFHNPNHRLPPACPGDLSQQDGRGRAERATV